MVIMWSRHPTVWTWERATKRSGGKWIQHLVHCNDVMQVGSTQFQLGPPCKNVGSTLTRQHVPFMSKTKNISIVSFFSHPVSLRYPIFLKYEEYKVKKSNYVNSERASWKKWMTSKYVYFGVYDHKFVNFFLSNPKKKVKMRESILGFPLARHQI